MNVASVSLPLIESLSLKSPFAALGRLLTSRDLAMDLGTANTLIYVKGEGIVLSEPSVVAIDELAGKPIAVGRAAKQMFGKTSRNVRCVRPMKDGVIADFEMTTLMITRMLETAGIKKSLRRPRIVIGVPSGITQVEKRAVIDAAMQAGARDVLLVEEPMAAALGADLPIESPVGNMVIDIGGGTTEVAILSMSATLYSHSIRVAGDEMDEAIQRHIRRVYGIDVGIFEAERIKMTIGTTLPSEEAPTMQTFGRDVAGGCPHQVTVTEDVVREALNEPVSAIISSVVAALEQASAEVSQDVAARGIYLAGGGALLKGLDQRLEQELGIKFFKAADPLTCVVRGVGKIVENLADMRGLCIA